jgi:hypothetical protein
MLPLRLPGSLRPLRSLALQAPQLVARCRLWPFRSGREPLQKRPPTPSRPHSCQRLLARTKCWNPPRLLLRSLQRKPDYLRQPTSPRRIDWKALVAARSFERAADFHGRKNLAILIEARANFLKRVSDVSQTTRGKYLWKSRGCFGLLPTLFVFLQE